MKVPKGFKRCKCRQDGRELGVKCPKLKRRDGSWNPSHGNWYGKADVTVPTGAPRVALRAGGFTTQDEMARWFTEAIRLLDIPEGGPGGHEARLAILALIHRARDEGSPLPSHDEVRRRHAVGASFEPGSTGKYLTDWIALHREHWSATTLLSYESAVNRLYVPLLGEIPLEKLTAADILKVFAAVDAESARITAARTSADPRARKSVAGRRPAGQATKQRLLAVLRSALGEACDTDGAQAPLLMVNVAAGIRFGRQRKGQKRATSRTKPRLWTAERERAWREDYTRRTDGMPALESFQAWRSAQAKPGPVMVWRPEHLGRFLDAASGHRMYALFCLLAYCALRRGEACGLRWAEIDFGAKAIMVGGTVIQVGWQVHAQDDAKTEGSESWVGVADEVIAALRDTRRAQAAERLAWGPGWTDTGYSFTAEDGGVRHPAQVSAAFERIAWRAGLPPVTLRDVRHCAPTYAIAQGVDIKVVSEMMRHASVKVTADLYALVLPELAKQVSVAVAAAIPRQVFPARGV